MGRITVLAGINGAGKSSIAGRALRQAGGEYFNPDEATRQIRDANPTLSEGQANALAWARGVQQLEDAIGHGTDYAFETTLGGNTITRLLIRAATQNCTVSMWYCGLPSPELHLQRVRARVAAGGHDIPEDRIRKRYDASRLHVIELMPHLHDLRVYDNSTPGDPAAGRRPQPRLLLSIRNRQFMFPLQPRDLAATPPWAKPIVAAAWKLSAP
jgi:predicted ABC-type ATPase